jgi:hypothetical protein
LVKLAKGKVIINIPHNWTSDKLSESIKSLIFKINKDNEAEAQFVVPVYANTNEAQVTPTKFVQSTGNQAAAVTVWTPAAGKKFRVLGGVIMLTKDAAAAQIVSFLLYDGANTVPIFAADISAAALVAIGSETVIPFNFGGNGYLSIAANNALNLQIGAGVLTAGYYSISVWGTEE